MKTNSIYFDKSDKKAFLETFLSSAENKAPKKAILIIPGGGYRNVAADREGAPVAEAFMEYGFVPFVLHYTVLEKNFRRTSFRLQKQ